MLRARYAIQVHCYPIGACARRRMRWRPNERVRMRGISPWQAVPRATVPRLRLRHPMPAVRLVLWLLLLAVLLVLLVIIGRQVGGIGPILQARDRRRHRRLRLVSVRVLLRVCASVRMWVRVHASVRVLMRVCVRVLMRVCVVSVCGQGSMSWSTGRVHACRRWHQWGLRSWRTGRRCDIVVVCIKKVN